jgi:hypothetical protein
MSGTIKKKILILGTILILFLSSIQIVLGDNIDSNQPEIINSEDYVRFNDCIILIFGTCNDVKGPLLWKLGLYCNFLKKDFTINAEGEIDESVNLMIRGGGSFRFLWGKENINIRLNRASGIIFWGGKSIIVESNHIIARCKAESAYLSY